MERRVAPLAALFIVLSLCGVAFAAVPGPEAVPLAAVTWPVSTLLVSEVQTGGASASDEFAEITNVGSSTVDLAGLELVYVTSTGTTVTRKASWATSTLLGAGRHMFVANTSGMYAGLADATYSGGFAATGGAIVLRAVGGAPVDAVGWGDATNAFVEGSPIAAPAAGASIERKPGGLGGNTIDSNANATDWFSQIAPNPQSLAAPPVPAPGATATTSPTVVPTAAPTATPTPNDTPAPTLQPTASPSVEPTTEPPGTPLPTDTPLPTTPATPEPTPTTSPSPTTAPTPVSTPSAAPTAVPTPVPTLVPTPVPTAGPTPTPTLAPTAEPTPVPTPTPAPTVTPSPVMSIADARGLANGTQAHIEGVLTTDLGALESGRKAFLQDATAGIAVYLDAAVVGGLPAGRLVSVTGTIDDRFAERTIRVNLADLVALGSAARPQPGMLQTGAIGEGAEGSLVAIEGTTVGSSTTLSDGLGLMVDDGSGQVRAIVGPAALGGLSVPSGTLVTAVGPVGQRDSSGTGLAGYRVHVTEIGDFTILPPPTPVPTATPTPTPMPTPTPVATATPRPTATPQPTVAPTAAPTAVPTAPPIATAAPTPPVTPSPTVRPSVAPSPSPSPTPGPTQPPVLTILEARGAAVGTVVSVAGVVTAERGRLGTPPLIAIADGTGGIAVRLPDGIPAPARGTTVTVKGSLADPYGQLELRPAASGFRVTGQGSLPTPLQLGAANLGEATEGRVATLTGTVRNGPQKATSGDLTIELVDASGTGFRVIADASSQIGSGELLKGSSYRLTGIVGQRASRKGALDGYRLYLRDHSDIAAATASGTDPGASTVPSVVTTISTVLALPDGKPVTIEGTVTAGATLLDSSGRRIVLQDATAAIEVFLPPGTAAPAVGSRIRATGTTGHAWGAPRLAATTAASIGGGSDVTAAALQRPPAERDEWLLVRLSGKVLKVERLGDRWRAEVELEGRAKVLVLGQAGAGIPSTAIVAGRRITLTGIVKRPYPTASDRRFAILPRGGADVAIGPAGDGAPMATLGSPSATAAAPNSPRAADITPDTDLATLLDHVGAKVRVGGLIATVASDGFDLDDGTALAHVVLRDDMLELLPHLREGEAVAATGTVELVDGSAMVVVGHDGTLVRVGSLGQALPLGGQGADASPTPEDGGGPAALQADSTGLGSGFAPSSALALAAITAMSVLVTVLRRRFMRRQLRAVLVDRLTTLRRKEA